MAKKILPRPYIERYGRATKHGWRSVGMCTINGKSYHELVHVCNHLFVIDEYGVHRCNGGYENYKFFTVCLSIITGEMFSPCGGHN